MGVLIPTSFHLPQQHLSHADDIHRAASHCGTHYGTTHPTVVKSIMVATSSPSQDLPHHCDTQHASNLPTTVAPSIAEPTSSWQAAPTPWHYPCCHDLVPLSTIPHHEAASDILYAPTSSLLRCHGHNWCLLVSTGIQQRQQLPGELVLAALPVEMCWGLLRALLILETGAPLHCQR